MNKQRKADYDKTESGGYRLKKKTETFSDISNAPIAPGDILTIWNEASEVKRTFLVNSIQDEENDSSIRVVDARVVDTTDPNERVGVEVTFKLPRAQPILGSLVRMNEKFDRLNAIEMNDLMAQELYKWLMSMPTKNYGNTFRECVKFLKLGGFIPADVEYTMAQNRVRSMMRQRGELFRSVGGKIFATGVDIPPVQGGKAVSGTGPAVVIRRVKLSKFYAGLRLILESGVLGEMILEE